MAEGERVTRERGRRKGQGDEREDREGGVRGSERRADTDRTIRINNEEINSCGRREGNSSS